MELSALMASYIACKLKNQYGPKDTARSCYALLSHPFSGVLSVQVVYTHSQQTTATDSSSQQTSHLVV